VFQREMQRTLAGLVGVCALVYLDDLIIYSKYIGAYPKVHPFDPFDRSFCSP
jgi:hypothetical protein